MKHTVKKFCEDVRGHSLSDWDEDTFNDRAAATCTRCGSEVELNLDDSRVGRDSVTGDAVTTDCDF